jgi:hypothetical protein
MKTLKILVIGLLLTVAVKGQDQQPQPVNSGFDGYIELGGKASSVFSNTTGFGDLKAGLIFKDKWVIGLAGSALFHGQELDRLVNDGSYHLYANYGGLFIERIFSFTHHLMMSIAFMTGQGEAYYQYDKPYRQAKVWSDEIIDRTTFGVQELSFTLQHRMTRNLWLGVVGSYRHTSPIEMIGTDKDLLENFNAGVVLRYHIF